MQIADTRKYHCLKHLYDMIFLKFLLEFWQINLVLKRHLRIYRLYNATYI